MERLNALDAEFLHLEDGFVHMHIAGACIFDDPPPSMDDVEALVASKLHRIPRYRQRVRTVPFELGRPVWVDDTQFELRYHLRHVTLPAPGDDAAFCRLFGRIMSQPLDRDRPLWEVWLVEGLAGGHWAMVFKVHHCMVDGIAGVDLLTIMLDLKPEFTVGAPEPWEPRAEPPGVVKVLDAWAGLASSVLTTLRGLPGAVMDPVAAARELARDAADVLVDLVVHLPGERRHLRDREPAGGPHAAGALSRGRAGPWASARPRAACARTS